MTNEQMEARIKELEDENRALRIKLGQKNSRNAGRKSSITVSGVERMKKMRSEGKSYADIGRALDVSPTTVYNKINPSVE